MTGASAAVGCGKGGGAQAQPEARATSESDVSPILEVTALSSTWSTPDPFLACMHHDDAYPAGNEQLGPAAPLAGRNLGSDFGGRDGWSMYHGQVVPGFPQHPHRGFETVTVVRRGLIDHADSLGAAARYGRGDVQWLTAGRGIQHAEMFPLLERGGPNPLELFQIWLNLPQSDKMAEPHFTMLWSERIPRRVTRDAEGRATEVTVIAGRLPAATGEIGEAVAPPPPPKSWAARPESDVAIWTIALAPHAAWTLPAAALGTNRALYFHAGDRLRVAEREIAAKHKITLAPARTVTFTNGPAPSELLLLQGRPIGEPVARRGPFVMNTREELSRAYADYRATKFGGWPWDTADPVHGTEDERFARFADGRVEKPA